MTFRKTRLIIGAVALFLALAPSLATAISPIDAVKFQVEHEYAAGRIASETRDDLLQVLAEAKSASIAGNTEAYRLHVAFFKDLVSDSSDDEINKDAAKRILSVARSL